MAKMKQVFVSNKRLNMSGGKLAAMTAHGAERFFSNWLKESVAREVEDGYQILLGARFDSEIFNNWLNSPTKIVLEAEDENQMQDIIRTAKEAGLVNGRDFSILWMNPLNLKIFLSGRSSLLNQCTVKRLIRLLED